MNIFRGLTGGMDRRDMLKGLATIPVLGAFALAWWQKRRKDHILSDSIISELNITSSAPPAVPSPAATPKIRLGIIGYGGRGAHLVRGSGFADPELIEEWKQGALANRGINAMRISLHRKT